MKKILQRLSKKGIELSLPSILSFIIIVGILFYLWFFLQGTYWRIHTDFQQVNNLRSASNLANVMIGTADALAYSEDGVVYRRILDPNKLDQIVDRVKDYYYPGFAHEVLVRNLETGTEWTAQHGTVKGDSVGVSIPVNIRYTETDIKIGVIKIVLSKE